MEQVPTPNMQSISFKNKCSVPEWMPDRKKEFRENADSFFQQIINSTPFFQGQEIELSYFQEGVGSIVAKVSLSNGNVYVIKTTETFARTMAEIKSYQAMKDNGIKVPEVYTEGVIDEHPFFVMEYFDQGTLKDKLTSGEMDVEEIAEIKAKVFMSLKKIPGSGYGWTTGYENGILQGNFPNIEGLMNEWFDGKDTVDIAAQNYPEIEWRKELDKRKEKIIKENKDAHSRFGSFDFATAHFFATEPPTFFDCNPRLEPEYFDLAFALFPTGKLSESEQILRKTLFSKYGETEGAINMEKFMDALWLQTFRKATNLLLRPDEKRTSAGLYMLGILSKEGELESYVKRYYL